MQSNVELIDRFYHAFQQRDYQAMNNCYSEDIVFNDPAFGLLRGDEVRAMWEMLCKNARDFSLTYSNIRMEDEEYGNCDWTATYTFSGTGRKVVNRVRAFMLIRDGKIVEHSDAFKLSRWAAQALGLRGTLLGWTGFMKRKIQQKARKNLATFMEKHPVYNSSLS